MAQPTARRNRSLAVILRSQSSRWRAIAAKLRQSALLSPICKPATCCCWTPTCAGAPSVIVADTVRGRGLPSLEARADRWFASFSASEVADLLGELRQVAGAGRDGHAQAGPHSGRARSAPSGVLRKDRPER